MIRPAAIIAAAVLAAAVLAAAPPAGAASQLELLVKRDLRHYQLGVEVDDLTSGQIAALNVLFSSNRSHSDKRLLAKSIIGGRNSLRGVLLGDR